MGKFRTIEVSDPRFEHDGLRCVTVKSERLHGRGDVTLFIPEQAKRGKPVPIVILLHGVYGSHWAWALKGGAHRTAKALIDQVDIPPMILAMPSDGLLGDGSGYLRQTARHRGGDFEGWIVEDVPALAAEATEGIADRSTLFIAGLSMGGFGALRIGAKHGSLFRGISGHSSITHFEQFAQFVEEPLSSYGALSEDQSVLATILQYRETLPPLRFDCGLEDNLLQANRQFHAELERHSIPHEYHEFTGGHEWLYWEHHLADSLRFFSSNIGGTTTAQRQ
jgi:putative tributyrin esterase